MEKLEFIIKAKDEFSSTLGAVNSKLPGLGSLAATAAAGVTAAGYALWEMTKGAVDAYDAVNDLSNRLGVTTEFISKMNYAAQMSGMSQDEMATSLRMVSVKLGEASRGSEQAQKSFSDLGISVRDTDGKVKSIDEIMPQLAESFRNLDSAAQRASVAQELFGRSGATMIPVLMDGKAGLEGLWQEAEKFGLVISTKAADNAAEFNDNLDRMKGSVTGLKNKLVEDLFPAFSNGFAAVADFIANNRETVAQWASVAVNAIGKVAEFIAYFGGVVADVFRAVHTVWEGAKATIAAFGAAVVNTLAWIIDKMADFLSAVNWQGMWDTEIKGLRAVESTMRDVGGSIGDVADKAAGEVASYWEGGMGKATKAVGDFVEKFKEGMASTSPGGKDGGEEGGVTIPNAGDDKALKEKEKAYESAYNQLLAMHDQYTLTEEEQLDAWYAKQLEMFTGHQEAMLILDETYQARKDEIKAARNEALNAEWEETVLSEEEKLRLWYDRQLEMYEGNEIAKAQIDQIYAKKKEDQKKKDDTKALTTQRQFYSNLETIGAIAGAKGVALAKAISIPSMIIDAFRASARAMAELPYPFNLVESAAEYAKIIGMVAQVRSVAYSGAAHGGMDYVPKEQTYLLDKGERVLSPNQNADLTQFLAEGGGSRVTIESLTVKILDNATDMDALKSWDRSDWQDLVSDKIIPAINEAARQGIKVRA